MNMFQLQVRKILLGGLTILAIFGHGQTAIAETDATLTGPIARSFFALPLEFDFDSGAANGDATILRIMPLYTYPVLDRWKLIHLDIISFADAPGGTPAFPGSPAAGQTAGMSDLLHASFYTPVRSGDFVWGFGAMLSAPTATDDSLGNGKWAAGPAFRLTYRTTDWNIGMIAGQRWSFAGSDNRADVNQLMIRGVIHRHLPNDWFFVSAPLIVANWDLPGEDWLVPVGGGIGRKFTLNKHPWAWSVQGYYNVIKPDSAPDWVVRFAIIAAIPFG
jgi:hypothetical protein